MVDDPGRLDPGPVLLEGYGSFRRHTFVIKSPRLGILNLKGASAADDIATDRSAVSAFFSLVQESENAAPSCDVLFPYCDLTPDGAVVALEFDTPFQLRLGEAYFGR